MGGVAVTQKQPWVSKRRNRGPQSALLPAAVNPQDTCHSHHGPAFKCRARARPPPASILLPNARLSDCTCHPQITKLLASLLIFPSLATKS